MSIEGSISIAFDFNDVSTAVGVDSLKKVRVAQNAAFTTGKVVCLSGTVSTTVQNIDLTALGYRDAAGDEVTISTVHRIAFQCDPSAVLHFVDSDELIRSRNNNISITCCQNTDDTIQLYTTSGTSSYTLAIYGA